MRKRWSSDDLIFPVGKTLLSGVSGESLTAIQREKLRRKWFDRVLQDLSPAQRKEVKDTLVRLNKDQSQKRAAHRPQKWTPTELTVLRVMFFSHRDIGKFRYAENIEMLASVWQLSEDTIRKRVTQALANK
jgi:hypothetical protein